MKVAVTGALGIVGAFASRELSARGHEVLRIDRLDVDPNGGASRYLNVDLTGYDQTVEALSGVEAVVHLAGFNAPIAAPEWQVHNNNVSASYNVLSASAALGISRVVQASSVNAIGLTWSRRPRFDYFPIDLAHPSYNEDGYSLSKLAQELQADSLARRHETLSIATLRLHAVLKNAAQAKRYVDALGEGWAIKGLFGYCTFASVADAIALALEAPFAGHEILWISEPTTFSDIPSAELHQRHYPEVPLRAPLVGHQTFFTIQRTRGLLRWTPSTEHRE
jgi:nucleoside-diphosphate-sugar epimerase